MKIFKIIAWLLALAVVVVGCTPDQPTDEPTGEVVTPPVEEYMRLSLMSGCGHNAATEDVEATRSAVFTDADGEGGLPLKWESVADDSATNILAFVLSDGEKPIVGYATAQPTEDAVGAAQSGLAVTPYEDDAYHADFQTLNYYATSDLANAKYCYAVMGAERITEDAENGLHRCHFELPATFTQTVSQNPGFLKEQMCMYATSAYKGERTILNFKHIPATFRFVVTNSKADAVTLQEVYVTTTTGAALAAKTAGLTFNWADGCADVLLGNGSYDKVSVAMGGGVSLANGEQYTAYAMALPLADNKALKDRTIDFGIKVNDAELLAFQLDGAALAELNCSNTYNWVSGKSYTIKINLAEDDKVTGEILAENRIEVTTSVPGTYTLVYEGLDGRMLLNYSSICSLAVEDVAHYEDFIDVNIAPKEASEIGIYDAEGYRQGSINISEWKPNYSEEPLYSFGILSDVHLGRSAINPDSDFERALSHFGSKGAEMVCICGDISQNGKEIGRASCRERVSPRV